MMGYMPGAGREMVKQDGRGRKKEFCWPWVRTSEKGCQPSCSAVLRAIFQSGQGSGSSSLDLFFPAHRAFWKSLHRKRHSVWAFITSIRSCSLCGDWATPGIRPLPTLPVAGTTDVPMFLGGPGGCKWSDGSRPEAYDLGS